MENKTIKALILSVLFMNLIAPTAVTIGAENISPIESIEEWGEVESTEEEGSQVSVESSVSEEVESSVEESESAEEAQADTQTIELDTTNPKAFLESLKQQERRALEYVHFVTEGDAVQMISKNTLRDGNKYYTAEMEPPFLPSALFFNSDRQAVQEAYLSVDDLIKFSADALNQQPQIYEGTIVEDFYVFSQENYAELEGKVIRLDSVEEETTQSNLEMFGVEDYLIEVSLEWLANEDVQNAFTDNELGKQVLIEGDIATLFNDIAKEKLADHPELSEFFSNNTSDFGGTINVDYTYGVFGIGLVSVNEEEQTEGIELYISTSSGVIMDFSEEIVYSQGDFVDFVGFDIIAEINELEASLTPDMFEEIAE